MKKICFYYHHINVIGGVEIAIINLCEKLRNDYDITIAYSSEDTDIDMVLRMSKYAKIVNLKYKQIEVDTVVYCSLYCEKDKIKAEKELRWVHGCLGDLKINLPKENIDGYISVGENCKKQLDKQLINQESILIYNVDNSDIYKLADEYSIEKRTLTLATVSRISREKGFERMLKVAEKIKDVDYIWHIVGEGHDKKYEQHIRNLAPEKWVFHGSKPNPFPFTKNADFLVQLSSHEAYSYSILESLCLGTPVIVANFPSCEELINNKNGFILENDLSNFDPEIFNDKKVFKHEYKSNFEKWIEML